MKKKVSQVPSPLGRKMVTWILSFNVWKKRCEHDLTVKYSPLIGVCEAQTVFFPKQIKEDFSGGRPDR